MKTKTKIPIQTQKLKLVSEPSTIYGEKITSSTEMNKMFRSLIEGANFDLSYQEHFFIIGLNNANVVKIFAHLSSGGCTSTIVDTRILFSHLLLSGCTQFAICHNHPTGEMRPSDADRLLTTKIKEAGKIIDVKLLEHIILSGTNDSYYSFADEGYL